MLQIELTTGQKVQMGVILAVLAGAGYLFFHNARKVFDTQVNAHTSESKYPVNTKSPVSAANPIDPLKTEIVTTFACADGKMLFTEYKNDPTKKPKMTWLPDPRHTSFLYFVDPLGPARKIKAPSYEHAIALAAYSAANGKALHLLTDVNLTTEQSKAEGQARNDMNAAITVIMAGVENGTFHTDFFDKVVAAVAKYHTVPGDPEKDKAKADSVRAVLQAASDYYAKVEDERGIAIKRYIAKMNDLLNKDQQAKLTANAVIVDANGGKPLTAAMIQAAANGTTGTPVRRGPASAPAGRRGNPTPRGGARGAQPAGGGAATTLGG